MNVYLDSVRDFHSQMDVSPTQEMMTVPHKGLTDFGKSVVSMASNLEKLIVGNPDLRVLRSHLLLEECGECVAALGEGNEVMAFDGLCDLFYVLLGTAVTFDWPLAAGFGVVHASNLTKTPESPRRETRVKGVDYEPPDLAAVLERHRANRGRQRPVESAYTSIIRTALDADPTRQLTAPGRQAVKQLIKLMLECPEIDLEVQEMVRKLSCKQ